MSQGIQSSAMLVELTMSAWAGVRTDRSSTKEVEDSKNAERGSVRVQKYLLGNCPDLSAITKHQAMVRKRHLQMTLPWLDTGVRLLPATRYFDYLREMGDYQQQQEQLVSKFINTYRWEVSNAQLKLGDLFNADDYPSVHELSNKFRMQLSYLPVPQSGDWRVDIGNAALEDLRKRQEQDMNDRLQTAMKDVWQRAYDALTHMSERLTDEADGEHKVFRDTLVSNALEVLDTLKACNITGDERMHDAHTKLEAALKGVNATALRTNEGLRKKTKKSIDEILKELPGLS